MAHRAPEPYHGRVLSFSRFALIMFKRSLAVLLLAAVAAAPAWSKDAPNSEKLIALTFDDGPRPYVLYGMRTPQAAPGLIEVLDKNNVKATFFVVGWRLTPKTWGDRRYEANIGITCIDAALQLLKDGHEIED